MIIHSLLQQMANDSFGTVNESLQIGVIPLTADGKPRNGIAITARGVPVNRTNINTQGLDFYIRDTNPLRGVNTAQRVLDYLQASYAEICNLPALQGYTTDTYSNVTITPVSSVEYVGADDNGGTSYVISGEIRYTKDN